MREMLPPFRIVRHDVAIALQQPFVDHKSFQPSGSTCVNLVRADADLCSKPEAEAVRETAAAIPKDVRRIHQRHEFFSRRIIRRHNDFRMAGAVLVDVRDRFAEHLAYRFDHGQRRARADR